MSPRLRYSTSKELPMCWASTATLFLDTEENATPGDLFAAHYWIKNLDVATDQWCPRLEKSHHIQLRGHRGSGPGFQTNLPLNFGPKIWLTLIHPPDDRMGFVTWVWTFFFFFFTQSVLQFVIMGWTRKHPHTWHWSTPPSSILCCGQQFETCFAAEQPQGCALICVDVKHNARSVCVVGRKGNTNACSVLFQAFLKAITEDEAAVAFENEWVFVFRFLRSRVNFLAHTSAFWQ